MRLRVAAAVLLALAAIVYAAGTLPLQGKAAAAADAYRRARDERRAAHARLGQAQRRESALRRASPVRAAGDGAEPLHGADDLPLREVSDRFSVEPMEVAGAREVVGGRGRPSEEDTGDQQEDRDHGSVSRQRIISGGCTEPPKGTSRSAALRGHYRAAGGRVYTSTRPPVLQ